MNNKGFTLIEMLGCLAILGIVLVIGLFATRDSLSISLSSLTGVSVNQIREASELYVIEKGVSWINTGDEEYTCITVMDLVDYGYFDDKDVTNYKGNHIKIIRTSKLKVIEDIQISNECK